MIGLLFRKNDIVPDYLPHQFDLLPHQPGLDFNVKKARVLPRPRDLAYLIFGGVSLDEKALE
jgi:hypothetical protein